MTCSEGHTWPCAGFDSGYVHKTCPHLTFHWKWTGALTNLEKGVTHRLNFSIERERCPSFSWGEMNFLALIIKLAKQIWFQHFNESVGGQQIAGSDINVSNVGGWLLTPGQIL